MLGPLLAPYGVVESGTERSRRIIPNSACKNPSAWRSGRWLEEPQGQGGLDGEIRVPPLPAPLAAPAGRPGSDRVRGQPHRHIAASNEGPVVGRPIRNAVLRLIRGMDLRLHPRSVASAETTRAGPWVDNNLRLTGYQRLLVGLSQSYAKPILPPSWCKQPRLRHRRAITPPKLAPTARSRTKLTISEYRSPSALLKR